jgi:hypothetical protein
MAEPTETGYYWCSPARDPDHRVLVRVGPNHFGVMRAWGIGGFECPLDHYVGYNGPVREQPIAWCRVDQQT